jgi:hypothetical protein
MVIRLSFYTKLFSNARDVGQGRRLLFQASKVICTWRRQPLDSKGRLKFEAEETRGSTFILVQTMWVD